MESVESSEVQTHLLGLLERVARGEEFSITEHGRPIARLIPAPAQTQEDHADRKAALLEWKAFSKRNTLGDDLTIRDLIEEGRRS